MFYTVYIRVSRKGHEEAREGRRRDAERSHPRPPYCVFNFKAPQSYKDTESRLGLLLWN